MNSWILPQNLLEQMITHRTGDALYFLFDTEAAKTVNSVELLSRTLTAAAKAMGVSTVIELAPEELTHLANSTTSSKLLIKHTFRSVRPKTELFERD